jgi:hypothetical protein
LSEWREKDRIEHMFESDAGETSEAGGRLGPLVAALQAELATVGPDSCATDLLGVEALEDAALIDALTALEVAKAACAAAQARLTERFVAARAGQAERLRAEARACADAGDFDGWVLARDRARTLELDTEDRAARSGASRSSRRLTMSRTGVAAEVALARRESPARGARLATASVALVRHLPHTLAALTAGVLNERRADLVVRATSHLDAAVRARVDAEVIGAHLDTTDPTRGVGGWGDRELERRVRACADRLDAEAAVARSRAAEAERRVTIRPVPDTMALVTALLPVAQAVAVHAALTRAAATAKATGDQRGKGQLMADTLVRCVTGQATASDVPVEVQLVMTDRALLAGDDTPAHIPGYGPVPAGWARDLLTRVTRPDPGSGGEAGSPARAWVRRLFTHPGTGTLVAMDSTRRLFPAALRRFVIARDATCRTPWCDAPVAHIDHVTPHAAGGPTSATNGQGLCVRCNLTKEQPGWHSRVTESGPSHTVEVITPTRHRYTSTAPPVIPLTGSPDRRRSGEPPAPSRTEQNPPPTRTIVLELYRPVPNDVELAS